MDNSTLHEKISRKKHNCKDLNLRTQIPNSYVQLKEQILEI